MNKLELKGELDLLNVDSNSYSLNGVLNPDSIILYNSYDTWQVFYLDERGGRDDEKLFQSEEEACKYILKLFKDSKAIETKFNIG